MNEDWIGANIKCDTCSKQCDQVIGVTVFSFSCDKCANTPFGQLKFKERRTEKQQTILNTLLIRKIWILSLVKSKDTSNVNEEEQKQWLNYINKKVRLLVKPVKNYNIDFNSDEIWQRIEEYYLKWGTK